MRIIGAVFHPQDDAYGAKYVYPVVPRAQFDAIVFVAETTAARRNRAVPAAEPLPVHDAPANLALAGDGIPTGWRLVGARDGKADATAAPTEISLSGGRTVRLSRHAQPQRWGDVRLVQKVDAQAWRGRRVRFSAAVRTEVTDTGAGALLLMRFLPKPDDGEADVFVRDLAAAASAEAPAQSPRWIAAAIEADVPEAAYSCALALVMSGDGSAWFGDLEFTMVAPNPHLP